MRNDAQGDLANAGLDRWLRLRPKGELDWIFPDVDEGYTKWTVEKVWQAGAHVMGRATYGDMASHWPTSTEPFAAPMNEIPKIVFSNSLKEARWAETRIVAGDLRAGIGRLKEESGRSCSFTEGRGLRGRWRARGSSMSIGWWSTPSRWGGG